MKILLVQDKERPHHGLSQAHVQQVKSVEPSLQVVVVDAGETQEITRHLEDADVLAGALWSISQIHDTKHLKWIHSFSAGVEHILTPEVKSSPVLLGNCSGIHATPIAEHIVAFILTFTKRLHDSFRDQQQKVWRKHEQLTELRGKTVLIAGLGHIGTEAARLLNAFDARVIAIDRPGKEKPAFVSELSTNERMEHALAQADFVVLALPYTQATHHLFDLAKFRLMKPSAVLINIGRGKVVHEQELIEALRKKIIAGAALDVTEEEPLPKESPLWDMDNVVITPHQSGVSEKYMDRAVQVFCKNLRAFLKGERLPHVVDKVRGY